MTDSSWKALWRKEVVTSIGRIATGAILLLGAFLLVESFRASSARENTLLSKRVDAYSALWVAIDSYGTSFVDAVRSDLDDDELEEQLVLLGEGLFSEVSKAGIHLGGADVLRIRESIGDVFIAKNLEELTSSSGSLRKQSLESFRRNWLKEQATLETVIK